MSKLHEISASWLGQIGAWLASAVVWAAAYLRDKKVTSQR